MNDARELERLRHAEAVYRLTMENISDAVFVTDDAGRFTYVCPNVHVIFRRSAEAVRRIGDIDTLLAHPLVASLPAEVAERRNVELHVTDADGAEHVVLVNLKRARVGPGTLLIVVRDVTERWALEARLARARRVEALDRFAEGIAHDVNNLLHVIGAHSAALRFEAVEPARIEELESIDDALARVSQLVDDLSAFARGGARRPDPLDLSAVLAAMARTLSSAAAPRRFVWTAAPDTPPIAIERTALERVLLNLVVNAAEATPPAGRVTVRAERVTLDSPRTGACGQRMPPGTYAALRVVDDGAGMPPAVAERVFEPYFTTKDREGGGVGLASSLSLVRRAGGYMTVETAPGAGTTMSVFVPA